MRHDCGRPPLFFPTRKNQMNKKDCWLAMVVVCTRKEEHAPQLKLIHLVGSYNVLVSSECVRGPSLSDWARRAGEKNLASSRLFFFSFLSFCSIEFEMTRNVKVKEVVADKLRTRTLNTKSTFKRKKKEKPKDENLDDDELCGRLLMKYVAQITSRLLVTTKLPPVMRHVSHQ